MRSAFVSVDARASATACRLSARFLIFSITGIRLSATARTSSTTSKSNLILLILFSSFLGLTLLADGGDIPCQSAGHHTDCGKDFHDILVRCGAGVVFCGVTHRRFLLSQGVLCCLSSIHLDRKGGNGRKRIKVFLENFADTLQQLIFLIHKGISRHIQLFGAGALGQTVCQNHKNLIAFRVGIP